MYCQGISALVIDSFCGLISGLPLALKNLARCFRSTLAVWRLKIMLPVRYRLFRKRSERSGPLTFANQLR